MNIISIIWDKVFLISSIYLVFFFCNSIIAYWYVLTEGLGNYSADPFVLFQTILSRRPGSNQPLQYKINKKEEFCSMIHKRYFYQKPSGRQLILLDTVIFGLHNNMIIYFRKD